MDDEKMSGRGLISGTGKNLLLRLHTFPEFSGLIDEQGIIGSCLAVIRIADLRPCCPPLKCEVVGEDDSLNRMCADIAYLEAVALTDAPERRLSSRHGSSAAAVRGSTYILGFSAPKWPDVLCELYVVALAVAVGDLPVAAAQRLLGMAGNKHVGLLKRLSFSGLVPSETSKSN